MDISLSLSLSQSLSLSLSLSLRSLSLPSLSLSLSVDRYLNQRCFIVSIDGRASICQRRFLCVYCSSLVLVRR